MIVTLRCISILAGVTALALLITAITVVVSSPTMAHVATITVVLAVTSIAFEIPSIPVWSLFGGAVSAALIAVVCEAGAEGLGLLYDIRRKISPPPPATDQVRTRDKLGSSCQ